MIRKQYVGKIKELQGKEALVRDDPGVMCDHTVKNGTIFVVAQFDDTSLSFGGVKMWTGWHPFLKTDFASTGSKPIF